MEAPETRQLFHDAVERAGRLREEMARLREEAFVAAGSSQGGGGDAPHNGPAPAATAPAGLQLVLPVSGPAHAQGYAQQHPQATFRLPVMLHVDSAGGGGGAHLKAAPGGGSLHLSAGGPWTIGAAPPPQAQQLWTPGPGAEERRLREAAQQQVLDDWSAREAAREAAVAEEEAAAERQWSGEGAERDALLAALRAEVALERQPLGSASAARSQRAAWRDSPAARHGSPVRLQRRSTPASSSRGRGGGGGEAQHSALPTFDPLAAERVLLEKLQQVNAAKRMNEARMRPGGGVPRLPLASLSRSGSAAGSLPGSGRRSSAENEQVANGVTLPQAAPSAGKPAVPGSSTPAAAPGSAAAAADQPRRRPRSPQRQSRVSLAELLRADSGGSGAAATTGAQVPLRTSSFNVAGAANAASAGSVASTAAATSAAAVSSAGAAGGAAGPQAPAAPAAAATQQPVRPGSAAVVPGEAAAPPIGDTPRDPAEETPREQIMGRQANVRSSLVGRLLGRLSNHTFGKLQSPPGTPLDSAASARRRKGEQVEPQTEASSSSASSDEASTASSGSPEPGQQERQPQRVGGGTVRPSPGLDAAEQAAGEQAPEQPEQQQPEQQPKQQAVPGPAAARATSASRLAASSGAASIGRKRSIAEAGCQLAPASTKKRSPAELGGRQQSRSAGCDSGGAAAAAAALEAAAGPASPVTGLLDAGAAGSTQPQALAQLALKPVSVQAEDRPSSGAAGSRLVAPVVVQHSPRGQRQQQTEPWGRAATPAPFAAPAELAPAAAAAAASRQQREEHQAPPVPQQQQQQTERRAPGVPRLPVAAAAAATAAAAAAAEQELPSSSRWVPSPRQEQQEQQQAGQANLPSRSTLLPTPRSAAEPAAATPLPPRAESASPLGSGCPTSLPASELAATAAAAAALAAAAAPGLTPRAAATPRRRGISLEPPEAGLCLRQDSHGRALLAVAPQLAAQPGGALLGGMRQGRVVRKAWVRPNFKAGGSVRRVQLAPGTGGRAELQYPSGLFRKPLRVCVRRVVVNSAGMWRPGAYLVLDTARGMLRLEPASAEEHAHWVLSLNAALLASGAGPASSGSGSSGDGGAAAGGDSTLLSVGDMRWSAAILFA